MKNNQLKLLTLPILTIAILLTVFPFAWLGTHLPTLNTLLGFLFPADAQHAIGHIGIFFMLGLITLIVLPTLRTRPHLYSLLLLVGIFQEGFQLLYKSRPLLFDDWRDLATDALGLLLAYLSIWFLNTLKEKAQSHHESH